MASPLRLERQEFATADPAFPNDPPIYHAAALEQGREPLQQVIAKGATFPHRSLRSLAALPLSDGWGSYGLQSQGETLKITGTAIWLTRATRGSYMVSIHGSR